MGLSTLAAVDREGEAGVVVSNNYPCKERVRM